MNFITLKNKLIGLIVLVVLTGLNFTWGQADEHVAINTLQYDKKTYQLSKGLEEVFKKDDHHSSSQLNITNGEFYQTQVWISGNLNWIWRTRKASVWLYVNLYAPGFDGLTTGIYRFKPRNTDENDPALSKTSFFKKGKLAIDLNSNGKLEKKIEYFQITDGKISLQVSGDEYIVEFDLILSNGEEVKGKFTADFDQV